MLISCGGGGVGDETASVSSPVRKVAQFTEINSLYTSGSSRAVLTVGNIIYVADGESGISIVESSGNNSLNKISSISLAAGEVANDLGIAGNYLFVAARSGGIKVYDVTDPAHPSLATTIDTPDLATSLTIDGNLLYLCDRLDFLIYDISTPEQPELKGSIIGSSNYFMQCLISDQVAYVAGYWNGLLAVDIANPEQPTVTQTIGTGFAALSLAKQGNHVIVGGESRDVKIYDIAKSGMPLVTTLTLVDSAAARTSNESSYRIQIVDNHAFIAAGSNGTIAVNLADLLAPYVAGSFVPRGGVTRDIFISNNIIYSANLADGIQVFSFQILADKDEDGFPDIQDAFPSDGTEWLDSDGDRIGNNKDTDDDNDGIPDNQDLDNDNDGVPDTEDFFPYDPSVWIDSDGDGIGDNRELVLVDNESIHCEVKGPWTKFSNSSPLVGTSYLKKAPSTDGNTVTWRPIIKSPGYYEVFATWAEGQPTNTTEAKYTVSISGVDTVVQVSQQEYYTPPFNYPAFWKSLGVYYFPDGYTSAITLVDEGNGNITADAILLASYVEIAEGDIFNNNIVKLGEFLPPKPGRLARYGYLDQNETVMYVGFGLTEICSVDVADPTNPVEINCYENPAELDDGGRTIVRKGDYLIQATREPGFRVYRIIGRGILELVHTEPTFDVANQLSLEGNLLLVGDRLGGLLLYDVTDPTQPDLLSRLQLGGETQGIKVQGNYAYVANHFKGMAVVDISDPETPTLVRRVETVKKYNPGIWDLVIKENYLFALAQQYGVLIFDITTQSDPQLAATIELPGGLAGYPSDEPPLGITMAGNMLFVSNGTQGVNIFDISDIRNIAVVDHFDSDGFVWNTVVNWPFMYVFDAEQGLKIADLTPYEIFFSP